MKRTTKHQLFLLGLLALGTAGVTFAASTIVHTDLEHAVQTIERVIFTPTGLPDPYEVPVFTREGTMIISGAFLTNSEDNKGEMGRNADSVLIGGEGNKNFGKNSVIVVGNRNTLASNTENSAIFGGYLNTIEEGNTNIIAAGKGNKAKGTHNTILGSTETRVGGTHNTALGASNATVTTGSHNIVAGANIKLDGKNNTFVWSDSKQRKDVNWRDPKDFTPAQDDTLYLRAANGVTVNTPTPTATLTVNGMVQIGDEPGYCTSDKYGTIIMREGCFYACSAGEKWKNPEGNLVNKWENLAGTPECAGAGILTNTENWAPPRAEPYTPEGAKDRSQGPIRKNISGNPVDLIREALKQGGIVSKP